MKIILNFFSVFGNLLLVKQPSYSIVYCRFSGLSGRARSSAEKARDVAIVQDVKYLLLMESLSIITSLPIKKKKGELALYPS